eukprot:5092513-Ditylum_brightwellii.AAC.1
MQVTTLSDLTSGDGTFILKLYLDGVYHKAPYPYQWSLQARPDQPYWRLWYEAITLSFNLDKCNGLSPSKRLGRWLPTSTSTGWVYSLSEDRMYKWYKSMWKIRLPILKHRGQLAHRRYRRKGNSSPLLVDAKPAKCVGTKATLFSTEWAEKVPAVQKTHKSMNLQE